MRAFRLSVAIAFAAIASVAYSKISAVPVADLIDQSDVIVIATVTRVTETTVNSCTVKHATAIVTKTLKGAPTTQVEYQAVPGCDHFMDSTADAIPDEAVLLFLKDQGNGQLAIWVAGRGRMPIRHVGSRTYATYWEDVRLPKDAPTIPGPEPKYTFIKSVELEYLERLIAAQVHPNPSLERP
jgi:hypothetical protein